MSTTLTARRASDFRESGNYVVIDATGQQVAVIYRDPESREWYEEGTGKHFSECWLGSTKEEALATLAGVKRR